MLILQVPLNQSIVHRGPLIGALLRAKAGLESSLLIFLGISHHLQEP